MNKSLFDGRRRDRKSGELKGEEEREDPKQR